MSEPETASTRLLVVDDDPVDREQLHRLAGRLSSVASVVDAGSVAEARARLAEGCDAVLLDLRLGSESGLDVLAAARALSSPVPCIVLTGVQDPETIVAVMRAGAVDYVAKDGLTVERLEQALRSALRVGAAEREVASTRVMLERQVTVLGSLVELAMRTLGARDAEAALDTGVRAGSVLFGARVSFRMGRGGRTFAAEYCPFSETVRAELPLRLAVPLLAADGRELGELVCERITPAFDRVDELAAMQLARAIAVAVEQHELIAESRSRQREREEIVAVVSHDLRAPLQTFAFGLDALRESEPSAAVEGVVTRMSRSARQMTRLIDDLLDVSRIHDGKLTLRTGRVVPAAILARVVAQSAAAAAERKATVSAEPAPEGLTLLGDEARLEQALGNLVANGLRQAPGGHIVVSARADGDHVVLQATHDGPSVPGELRARMFERLYQGEAGHRGALGLGLYIVRGIAEAHGGTVGVADAPGGGTTFWLRVPMRPPG